MTRNTKAMAALDATMVHHARLKKASALAEMLDAEYPAIDLIPVIEDGKVVGWMAEGWTEEGQVTIYEGTDLPTLAVLLEACEENDVDPEEGEAEDQGPSGSVVAETYRVKYATASTNGQTCGDWLAETLTTWCHGANGFHIESFEAMLAANNVDQSGKWAKLPESGQKGWVGRWRMNGRQALEKAVAWNGTIADPTAVVHEVPEEELAALRAKHAKWIAKQQKLEAALKQD